jgi:hypothetical protein
MAKDLGKNLLQPGCKPGCLQSLTKRRIDPTRRSITQRYLVDLLVGSILLFVRGCKYPGLQSSCSKKISKILGFLPSEISILDCCVPINKCKLIYLPCPCEPAQVQGLAVLVAGVVPGHESHVWRPCSAGTIENILHYIWTELKVVCP